MGEGKTNFVLIIAVVAAIGLAVAGTVYVRTHRSTSPEVALESEPEEQVATTSDQNRTADILSADDYLDEALNDLDAVNF